MTEKMGICIVKYTYERYVGIDVEKLAWKLHDYAEQAFAEFHPIVSEPGNGVEMPDYVDVMLCKKDGCTFNGGDIKKRALNIPDECRHDGLTLSIEILISDRKTYRYKHKFHSLKPKEDDSFEITDDDIRWDDLLDYGEEDD